MKILRIFKNKKQETTHDRIQRTVRRQIGLTGFDYITLTDGEIAKREGIINTICFQEEQRINNQNSLKGMILQSFIENPHRLEPLRLECKDFTIYAGIEGYGFNQKSDIGCNTDLVSLKRDIWIGIKENNTGLMHTYPFNEFNEKEWLTTERTRQINDAYILILSTNHEQKN